MKTSIKITIAAALTAVNLVAVAIGGCAIYLHHVQTSVEASCLHIDNNIRYGHRVDGELADSIKKINSDETQKMNDIYNRAPFFLKSKVGDIINDTVTKYMYAE